VVSDFLPEVRSQSVRFTLGVDSMCMPYEWNCIIHFCGWCHECFRTKLYMLAISCCHFWDCISVFFVHLSTDSFIPGAKGGTLHFFRREDFFAVPSNAFIQIHISRWFCSMGHSWSYSLCDRPPPPVAHLRLFWREKILSFIFGRNIARVKIVP
jgi:hypothetical protein